MSLLEAIVLGLVQGLTEFLPISSSAHLIVVPWLFGWDSPGLAFDTSLHLGTLTAVICYFWRDLLAMARALPRALADPRGVLCVADIERDDVTIERDRDARLALLIALGTIPGAVIGFVGEGAIERVYYGDDGPFGAAIVAIAIASIVLGSLLLAAERIALHERCLDHLTLRDALTIGIAQAAALIPGVSRSGATITAGLFQGLRRADAARFSFLLGVPIIAAAGLKGLLDALSDGLPGGELGIFAAGMIASGLAGFAAIWGLLRFLQRASTVVFVVYRFVFGALLIALVLGGVR
jgi:undecaprenyl-diphosphatase